MGKGGKREVEGRMEGKGGWRGGVEEGNGTEGREKGGRGRMVGKCGEERGKIGRGEEWRTEKVGE